MSFWLSLFLIAALFGVATFLLYARFSNRSTEKSIHHLPVDLSFSYDVVSEAATIPSPEELTKELSIPVEIDTAEPDSFEVPVVTVEKAASKEKAEDQRESDYIDELQEAAAGLAMLMRSSSAGRTEPVVYAPEAELELEAEVEEEVEEVLDEEIVADEELPADELIEAESVSPPEPVAAAMVKEKAVSGEKAAFEEEEEAILEVEETFAAVEKDSLSVEGEIEFSSAPDLSLADIVGEDIFSKFDSIDGELDALEDLVAGLESSLAALGGAPAEDIVEEDAPFSEAA